MENNLTLKVYATSKFGYKTNRCYEIKDCFPDDRWGGKKENISAQQFVLDCSVRDMVYVKDKLENLECIPIFLYCDEDITSQLLPSFVEGLNEYVGVLNFTDKREKKELGTLKYLDENGLII